MAVNTVISGCFAKASLNLSRASCSPACDKSPDMATNLIPSLSKNSIALSIAGTASSSAIEEYLVKWGSDKDPNV